MSSRKMITMNRDEEYRKTIWQKLAIQIIKEQEKSDKEYEEEFEREIDEFLSKNENEN